MLPGVLDRSLEVLQERRLLAPTPPPVRSRRVALVVGSRLIASAAACTWAVPCLLTANLSPRRSLSSMPSSKSTPPLSVMFRAPVAPMGTWRPGTRRGCASWGRGRPHLANAPSHHARPGSRCPSSSAAPAGAGEPPGRRGPARDHPREGSVAEHLLHRQDVLRRPALGRAVHGRGRARHERAAGLGPPRRLPGSIAADRSSLHCGTTAGSQGLRVDATLARGPVCELLNPRRKLLPDSTRQAGEHQPEPPSEKGRAGPYGARRERRAGLSRGRRSGAPRTSGTPARWTSSRRAR